MSWRPWTLSPASLAGWVLRAPLRLVPSRTVVRVPGGVNRGLRWITGSSVHGCWLGHYEQEKQEAIVRFLSPRTRFFDVGANAGFYTLAAARRVGPEGHVWAFEPLAENARNLLRHVQLNALGNVTVVQTAVAAQLGISGFSIAGNNAMGHLGKGSSYLVPTVSLDEFSQRIDVGLPDLIKIDVEGAEQQVLEGAKDILGAASSVIFLSLHGQAEERGCLALLERFRYRVHYLDGRDARDRPLQSDEVIALPPGFPPPANSTE